MAAISGVENDPEWQQIQEEITCSICSDIFCDPKTIPCLHTFCKECLERSIVANKKMGIASCCPLCRATLPENDLNVPTNFRIKRFIEIFRKRTASSNVDSHPSIEAVHGCGKCEKDLLAVTWCVDCQVSLCSSCDEIHTKWKDFKLHTTATIEEYLQNPNEFMANPKQPQHIHHSSRLASKIVKDNVDHKVIASTETAQVHASKFGSTTHACKLSENFGKMELNEKAQPHTSSTKISLSKGAKPVINLSTKTKPSYPLFVAKYDYSAEVGNVLSFKKGDVFYVINDEENLWLVRSKDSKNQGYVPSSYFAEIGSLSTQE